MTPERLAEIEQQARANSEMGCVCLTCDCATLLDLIAHIRDLETPPKCARGCDRDGVGSPCIHELSPDELTGVASHIRDLEAQLAAARETLEKIWNMGHNDDCIFCGLKDSVAVKWMPQPEVWQAENPTATPPSPEVPR